MVRWNHYKGTEQTAHDQLDMARDHGVNFFDTAEVYAIPPQAETQWVTEKILWNWMKKRGNREDIIVATKVAGPSNFTRLHEGKWITPETIKTAIDHSLQRLQTDYIDLYQLHRPQRPVALRWKMNYDETKWEEDNHYEKDMLEILKTLQTLQKSGQVRYFWLSNETPRWVMKFLQLFEKYNLPRMQSIQNAYNLLRREYEVGLSEISLQENIGLLAYSPLAGGILTGKYQWGKMPKGARYSGWGKNRMTYYAQQSCIDAVDKYQKIAAELWITVTQLALARINDRNFVTSNIIGSTDVEQLEACLSSADINLPSEAYTKIDEIFAEQSNPACW